MTAYERIAATLRRYAAHLGEHPDVGAVALECEPPGVLIELRVRPAADAAPTLRDDLFRAGVEIATCEGWSFLGTLDTDEEDGLAPAEG